MGAIPYSRNTRKCGDCGAVNEHELVASGWTYEHGVVQTFRCASRGCMWSESRLPLDDPRNVSPFRHEKRIE